MQNGSRKLRSAFTWTLFVIGIVLVVLSLVAEVASDLDVTPGFGVVQMGQLLIGVTCLTVAGFVQIYSLRPPDSPRSLQADIGIRLALTGLVFCYVAGFSDLLRVGTHTPPRFERPFAGPWQLGGIAVGIFSIIVGMLLYHTSRGSRTISALGWLIPDPLEPEPEQQSEADPAPDTEHTPPA